MLLGPTAVGKTSVSIELARMLDAEIISADSRQCFKYLDIGTAKPTPNQLDAVPHYNVSLLKPDQPDNAAAFRERALQWSDDIQNRGKKVMYVGGSTLHLQGLVQPFDDVPSSDAENQAELKQRAKAEGLDTLYDELKEVDPEYADRMDGLNKQRIIRALDVYMQTGKPFSDFHTTPDEIQPPDDMIVIGLHRPRPELHERIKRRTALMFKKGLVDEVRSILRMGYHEDVQALRTVGYREVIQHLKGRLGRDQMVADINTSTRRYAKRQITWFRRWSFIHWFNASGHHPQELANKIGDWLAAKSINV